MMVIRPAREEDLAAILGLAGKAGVGLTSLPASEPVLAARIERALRTWNGGGGPGEQGYLFVLEDCKRRRVVGISAIEVAVGLTEPWYHFHLSAQSHCSPQLNVNHSISTLCLKHDHPGQSELCTLFLDPAYRQGKYGHLLAKSRLLFIAAFRARFGQRLVAQMRGYSDSRGRSPFWRAVGQRFYPVDFRRADYLSGTGSKTYIAELMPRHPLYVDFLPAAARRAIGQVHPDTAPALRLLNLEGLRYQGYIDIFDGGPALEADIDQIRAVRDSRRLTADIGSVKPGTGNVWRLLANEDYGQFRAVLANGRTEDRSITLDPETAEHLGLRQGQSLRAVDLFATETTA